MYCGHIYVIPLAISLNGSPSYISPPRPPVLLQLPGRLQTLLRLKQEKEELAKLKDGDPLKQIDPDEASRRRLRELREAVQPPKPSTRTIQPDEDDEVCSLFYCCNGGSYLQC